MKFLFILLVCAVPGYARAQEISFSLDSIALDKMVKKNVPNRVSISGPFYMSNFKVTSIQTQYVHGSMDLDFRGTIPVHIPFMGKKYIKFNSYIPLEVKFKFEIRGRVLRIPVESLIFKAGFVNVSTKSKMMAVISMFKKMLSGSKGNSALQKSLTFKIGDLLDRYFGKNRWKMILSQKKGEIKIKAVGGEI
ncbi:MAG: hypothetical protein JXR95_10615 [Deltaproteobacteria bacterium]|nr:hypothetical protein [Deltaproteobacteria bacterium]